MDTALVYTLNDLSTHNSTLITLFGNPNDYVWKLANFSAHADNFPVTGRYRLTTVYDSYHAVAVDVRGSRIYHGNNAEGVLAYFDVNDNTTEIRYYNRPPTTKRVNFTIFCFANPLFDYL